MKILTNKKPLLEELDLVKDAVSKHAAVRILKDVKITAEGESLHLYTTNVTWASRPVSRRQTSSSRAQPSATR